VLEIPVLESHLPQPEAFETAAEVEAASEAEIAPLDEPE
jgi:hypothetical protein